MKKLQILLPLAAVLLTLTGCKKDNEKSVTPGETVTLTATLGGGEKTEINGFDMKWSAGDKVTINTEEYEAKFPLGDYTTAIFEDVTVAEDGKYEAYYPASLYDKQNDKYVLPQNQAYDGNTLSSVNPMYAVTTTKTLQFNNICALVKLEVTGAGTVRTIVVTSDNYLCGEFSVEKNDGKYHAVISGSGSTTLTLNCGIGVELSDEPTTFYIALPQGDLGNLTFKIGGYTSDPVPANLEAGKLYTKTLENVEAPVIEFSVSTTQKVKFAPGNLYYNGADGAEMNDDLPSGWNFYEHQWDCYPSGTSSVDESMEINLFTWGYGTWSTVYDTYDFETGDTMEDWGSVAIGSDPANTWRTLSNDEWNYLLSINPEASEQQEGYGREDALKLSKWSAVTFGGSGPTVNGLIIMPDGWEGDLADATDYTAWQSLESSGAVFLPAAGCRGGTDVLGVGSYGYYWSSTPYGVVAYLMYFYSGRVSTSSDVRDYGNAVRLVR